MRTSSVLASFASMAAAAVITFVSGSARAVDLSACGDIAVDSNAHCELDTSGGCTAKCTPINVVASCSAQLQVSCSGSCNVSADASCTTSCQGSCEGSCNANPGSYDCEGDCTGTCEGDCTSQCSSNANQSQCTAECKANCSGSCSAKCSGTPPSATCQARCSASCSGSCSAEVNASCNIDCQSKGEASCEASVTGGCQAQCSQPKGALFCDGQFVNTTDVDNCIDQLKKLLNITVSGSASSSCDGGSCSAEAQGSITASPGSGCSTAPSDEPIGGTFLLAGVGMLGIVVARRKKDKRANG